MDHHHEAITLTSYGWEIIPYTCAPKPNHQVGKQFVYALYLL